MRLPTLFIAAFAIVAVVGAPLAARDHVRSTANQFPAAALGVYGHVSETILQELLRRDAEVSEYIVESMLNMTTRGTARADCHIGLELIPDAQRANLRLTMQGTAIMDDAISTTRGVTIHSASQTRIRGHKDVFFSAEGFTLGPARATCDTSIQVHDIDARLRLVERLAWRRSARMQPQAEQAAAERAARRAERQLEAEAGKPLGQLQKEYATSIYEPLSRKGSFPLVRFATTSDYLKIRCFSRETKPAASDDQSKLPTTAARDVAVCFKDSYVNEILAPLAAGRTITDRQFAEVMLTLTGSTPRPLWVHDRAEPWSVTAADRRPIVVEFAGELISITFRIDRAARGDRTLARPATISAKYALAATRDGPRLIRQGNLSVELAQDQIVRTSAAQSSLPPEEDWQRFLTQKFSGVFMSELYFDGLMPPAGGTWGKLRSLKLTQLSSRDGWFALGYER